MAVELAPIHPEELDWYTPETADRFDAFVREEFGDRLQPVAEQEINDAAVHWRGLDPHDALGLIGGHLDTIELRSNMPNTTKDWHKAISYGRGLTRYQLALGFDPERTWDIKPAMTHVPKDLEPYETTLSYQRGNFIVNGDLHLDDLRYVIIRAHGTKPGQTGECRFYRYAR